MSNQSIDVGDLVEAGDPGTEDYDRGRVLAIDGRMADVAWEGGAVRTDHPVWDLRLVSEVPR